MPVIDISEFRDSVVIHFQVDGQSVNAYTLATTIVAIADAAKAANAELNPGYDIEVVVDALGPGSFRAKITAVYKQAKNLFSNKLVEGIILGVIGNFIYERTLSRDPSVQVIIQTDEVIVQRGQDRLVVPRNVYDATRRVEKHAEFTSAISTFATAVVSDPDVKGIAFVPRINSPPPEMMIQKGDLADLGGVPSDGGDERIIEEESSLQIVKAILRRGRRKWEFVWRGVNISAPVLDQAFYAKFFAHEVTIAPGDSLRVRLALKQKRDPDIGVFTTWEYEVREVFEHIPQVKPMSAPTQNKQEDED